MAKSKYYCPFEESHDVNDCITKCPYPDCLASFLTVPGESKIADYWIKYEHPATKARKRREAELRFRLKNKQKTAPAGRQEKGTKTMANRQWKPTRQWIMVDVEALMADPPAASLNMAVGQIRFNQAGKQLLDRMGLIGKGVNLYQDGQEFALAAGQALPVKEFQVKGHAIAAVSGKGAVRFLAKTAKKFDLRVEDGYLVLSPAKGKKNDA